MTTVGITTMADLLNPIKLFPNSYASLTVPAEGQPQPIYVNSTASVDQALINELPSYIINSLA